jgi:tetratricopeptide (TPR) repeat protein
VLKTTFLSGVILALLTGGALIALSLLRPEAPPPAGGLAGEGFYPALRDFDTAFRRGGEGQDALNRRLDGLEKEGQGLEAALSVLKRRRYLARTFPGLLPQYRKAVRKAAGDYPHSEALAALAAEALLRESAITGGMAAELRNSIPLLASAELSPLRVSLHILLGDFRSPRTAAEARLDAGLAAALPRFRLPANPAAAEALITDLAILKLLNNDTEAGAEIQAGLSLAGGPSPEFIRFAAEYSYDFRDPLRAAELFARLDTPADIIRQADALWLSGSSAGARNLWTILISPPDGQSAEAPVPAALSARALYNLALTAADGREAAAWLERLAALPAPALSDTAAGPAASPLKFGRILLSRLQNTQAALATLEEGLKALPQDPLLDLELLRRRAEIWEPGRVAGETWLLLGRHPQAAELYQWAAWYFAYQRQPAETAILLKTAEHRGISLPVLRLHEALAFIESGDPDRAEAGLRALTPETADWAVFANLGRLLETRRSPAAAIEQYETAASMVQNPREAARIQLRIALCLKSLGRPQESRRVLEYALDLDPANLKARLELSRLNGSK